MKTSSSIFPLENVKALGNSLNQEINITLRMCEGLILKSQWTLLDIYIYISKKESDHEDIYPAA